MQKLDLQWQKIFQQEFIKEYFVNLERFLQERAAVATILPPREYRYRAFELTPFKQVKVVIMGQDPYHGEQQANGLAFSVLPGCRIPPSLRNIYKELYSDLSIKPAESGDLSAWAKQGVLMINAMLSVELGQAGSHQKKGWELFTDQIISTLNQQRENLVFILWGNYARKKAEQLIDIRRHKVILSAHPSPLAASRGFFGSAPFSKANNYLEQHHITTIDWSR